MPRQPNLLFIMPDQQKATSLDLYNTESSAVETVQLRRLADEGVTFDAAYCPSPLCVPSRIATLTGQYPSHTGFIGNAPPMQDQYETVFSAAKRQGHHTMLVGKDHAYAQPFISGDPDGHPAFMNEIFDRMYLALHNGNQPAEVQRDLPHHMRFVRRERSLYHLWGSAVAPWDGEDSLTARLCDVARGWLGDWAAHQRSRGAPFSMWLSIPDPHEFYQCPRDVYESIDPDRIVLPPNWNSAFDDRAEFMQFMRWYYNAGGVPEDVARKLIRVYLAMCKNIDNQLKKVFDELQRLGEWENTLIIYASDHGDLNGEHRLVQKSNCGYEGCVRVPMIIAQPGRTVGGRRDPDPANLVDLPATCRDLLGWDAFPDTQGRSLASAVTEASPPRRAYTVVESGVPGPSLTTKDIENFPDHRWDRIPIGRPCHDPPHRYTGKLHVVRSQRYKLITRQHQATEFYDLHEDPWEMRNLAPERQWQGQLLRHHELLLEHLQETAPLQPDTAMQPWDDWYPAGGEKKWLDCVPAEKRGEAGPPEDSDDT